MNDDDWKWYELLLGWIGILLCLGVAATLVVAAIAIWQAVL